MENEKLTYTCRLLMHVYTGSDDSSGSGEQDPARRGRKLQGENGKTGATPEGIYVAQRTDKGFEKVGRRDE